MGDVADDDLVIVGSGLTSAFGVGVIPNAAACRAGLAAFAESQFTGLGADHLVLAQVPDDVLPPAVPALAQVRASARELRLARLAAVAVSEARCPLNSTRDLPLLVALPEQDEHRPNDRRVIAQAIAAQGGRRDDGSGIDTSASGRAGGLIAISRAKASLLAGEHRFALVVGVDSYAAVSVLARLVGQGRIAIARDHDGFIPGEGAAALLLTLRATAQERGLPIRAVVSGYGYASEPGFLASEAPNRGEGLTTAIAAATATLPADSRIREVYASFTGEAYWAKEWGAAAIRQRARLADDHGMHHPADAYGELGAASGVAQVVLATHGMNAGYRRTPCLVFAASDGPDRAAVVLTGMTL